MAASSGDSYGVAAAAPLLSATTGPHDPPLQAGQAAHREFLAGHRGMVRRFVGALVGDGADADDVTQQTLQQALQNLDSFHGGNLRAWLFCIARNVISNRRRDSARLQFMEFDTPEFHASTPLLQTAPDSIPMAYDARARVQRCLGCLATNLRRMEGLAVLLADVHGFSDKEAAARLRLNLPSFKFLLHKARMHLHATAAAAEWGAACPLVSKTGVLPACMEYAQVDGQSGRADASHAQSNALDDQKLAALWRDLVADVIAD